MYFLCYFIFNSADNHHFRCFLIGFRQISIIETIFEAFQCFVFCMRCSVAQKTVSNNHVYLFFLLCDLNIILRLLSSQWQMKCFSNRLRSFGTNFCWIRFWCVSVCVRIFLFCRNKCLNIQLAVILQYINLNSSSHTHIKIDSCYFEWIIFNRIFTQFGPVKELINCQTNYLQCRHFYVLFIFIIFSIYTIDDGILLQMELSVEAVWRRDSGCNCQNGKLLHTTESTEVQSL